MSDFLFPVILCGGVGTRLWPLSRESCPKQFLALTDRLTLLQQTVLRLQNWSIEKIPVSVPMLVCNEEHRFLSAGQLQQVGVMHSKIILEPQGRNTAPALTLAALQVLSDGVDPFLLVMPADHHIGDVSAFQHSISLAIDAALNGDIVTFGVSPDRPETGFGYIRCRFKCGKKINFVEEFVEKPKLELAEEYIRNECYLWNSGIYLMRASVWIDSIKFCRPDILEACQKSMWTASKDVDFIRPNPVAFDACPSESIDYAVMERLPANPECGISVAVVPLQAGWSDVGAWGALWEVSPRDSRGNATKGEAVLHQDCFDTLIISSGRLVVGLGLKNLAIIDSPDAVLVIDMNSGQDIKQLVARLDQNSPSLVRQHRKVHRPWGWYDRIDGGECFQVKRIVVNPGASLSLQKHKHRAEHWVVVKGVAEVTHGDRCFRLQENESTYIPPGHVHRLNNPGTEPLEIIEIQSGSYLGEDDIVRLDDDYGRVS